MVLYNSCNMCTLDVTDYVTIRPPSIMLENLPKMLLGNYFPYYAQTPSYYARLY